MDQYNRKWVGDRLWYLLNLQPDELRRIFPDQTWDNLKNKRKIYRKRIKKGLEMAPRRPRDYELGDSPEAIRDRLTTAPLAGEMAVNHLLEQQDRENLHRELEKALDNLAVDPSFVKGFRVSQWEGVTKDNDGEAQIHTLHGFRFNLVAESLEPQWDIVRRVETAPIELAPRREHAAGEYRREVILPDFQIGFWRQEDGSLLPMHDEKAIDVALQIVRDVNPSRVVILGDFLDLPNFSKYPQTPEFAHTTNATIEYGHKLLRTLRELLPDSALVLIEGNHDKRLGDAIKRNFMEAYNIRRAGEKLPVMSVPYLLALDQLGVEYVGGYPAGRYFITPTLMCIHGEFVAKGRTARQLTEHEGVSTIQGHIHRQEAYARTTRTFEGARQTFAYSPGTLSRIDGYVPSVHGGLDGSVPSTNHEDWQQGLMVIEHDGNDFYAQQVSIDLNHRTRFEGRTYQPSRAVKKAARRRR